MSYTTIVHIFLGNRIEYGPELSNSWGSAPVVWDAIGKKYIGHDFSFMYNDKVEKLWKLYSSQDIPIHQRVVLMMTFDRAYVLKKDYSRAARDIRLFLEDFPQDTSVANHWPSIADYFESDPDVPAIGLWCTSVSENPFNGRWNDDRDEYEPPDWEKCFDIYECIV